MSLFSLLSTAVAVPLAVVLAAFMWFFIRAQMADKQKGSNTPRKPIKKIAYDKPAATTPFISNMNLSASIPVHQDRIATLATAYTANSSDTLSYQPLSSFLGSSTLERNDLPNTASSELATLLPEPATLEFDIKDIPGINSAMEKELFELGYTSVEQIARWGRADVRAVSATLGVDQQKIEDEWIAGARLILSIR